MSNNPDAMPQTGQPQEGAGEWVIVARIVRPQGRRGELLADLHTDFPESFRRRKRLFLLPSGSQPPQTPPAEARAAQLDAFWLHKGRVVLKLAGIDSIGDAEKLRGVSVAVPRSERIPLSGGEVYIADLIGARLIDVGGDVEKDLGEIADVLPQGPASTLLAVRAARESLLIPFAKAYLKKIDLEARRIEMDLPKGLTEIDAPMTGEERREVQDYAGSED